MVKWLVSGSATSSGSMHDNATPYEEAACQVCHCATVKESSCVGLLDNSKKLYAIKGYKIAQRQATCSLLNATRPLPPSFACSPPAPSFIPASSQHQPSIRTAVGTPAAPPYRPASGGRCTLAHLNGLKVIPVSMWRQTSSWPSHGTP